MDDQPSNVNQWDELGEWAGYLPRDAPHGELGTNGGDYGLTDQLGNKWILMPESESKCMAIISSEKLAVPRYTLT